MFTAKKFISLLLITMLLLANLPMVSFAEELDEQEEEKVQGTLISTDEEPINLYESAATDSSVLTQLENDTKVTIMEKVEEYIHVQYVSANEGEIWDGFVKSENISTNDDLLDTEITEETLAPSEEEQTIEDEEETTIGTPEEFTDDTSATEPEAQATGEKLKGIAINAPTKTYASPSTSAQVIKRYAAGTELSFYDYSTYWYEAKVKVSGVWQTVYIQKSAIETIVKDPVQVEAVAKLNPTVMYEKPSTYSKKVKPYDQGYILKLYTYTSSWYKTKVKVNGEYQTAYVPKTSIQLPSPSSKAEQGVALKNPANIYSYTSTNAKTLKTYTEGSILKVYSYTDSWYRVTIYVDGVKKTGYILKSHLEKVAEESTKQTGLAQKSPTKIYKKPSTTAGTLKTYAKNSALKYRIYSNNWYAVKVKVNGEYQTGYIKKSDISSQTTTSYGLSLDKAVSLQMKMSPVTDESNAKMITDELLYTSMAASWNSAYWENATAAQVRKYLNPVNYSPGSKEYYQFLILSKPAGTSVTEINTNVLNGKGVLAGKAASFIQAASSNSINEVYLISHALLETANGTSPLATGIKYNGTTVYNMYGIGAYDYDPNGTGAKYADNQGWTSVEKAIVGGAAFVAKSYIHVGQDTLYKMRWNPESMATKGYASHQYATDIGWAVKQTARMAQIYGLLTQYSLLFDVPSYKE